MTIPKFPMKKDFIKWLNGQKPNKIVGINNNGTQ